MNIYKPLRCKNFKAVYNYNKIHNIYSIQAIQYARYINLREVHETDVSLEGLQEGLHN